jgi:hypothetical protein
MWICILAALFLINLCISNQAAAASAKDQAEAASVTTQIISLLQKDIAAHGSDNTRKLDKEIKFISKTESGLPDARAWRDKKTGKRYISINNQLDVILDYYVETAILTARDNRLEPCHSAYNAYLESYISETAAAKAAIRKGLKVSYPDLLAPEDYAVRGTGPFFFNPCAPLAQMYPPFPREFKAQRDSQVAGAIAMIYLHELGHHAKGHVDQRKHSWDTSKLRDVAVTAEDLKAERRIESEADLWSVDTAFELGTENTVVNTGIFMFLTLSSGLDTNSELQMDHPLGLRRQYEMLEHYRSKLLSTGKPVPPIVEWFFGETKRLLEKDEVMGHTE